MRIKARITPILIIMQWGEKEIQTGWGQKVEKVNLKWQRRELPQLSEKHFNVYSLRLKLRLDIQVDIEVFQRQVEEK